MLFFSRFDSSFCPTFGTLLPSFIMLFFSRFNFSFCPTFSTLLPSFISTRPIQRNTSHRPRSWTKFVSTATSFTHLLNCSRQHFIKSTSCCVFNPYKPCIHFMGHWQTVQNQIRQRRMWRLIWFCTIFLQNELLKYD